MPQVVHSIHFPVSARNFVEPMVAWLNSHGIQTELWLENQSKHEDTIKQIAVPRRFVCSDISFNPFSFFRRLRDYRKELRQTHPQVLHCHQARASLIPLLAARLERVPFRVYQNHGLPYLGYRGPLRWMLRSMEQVNISLATHVLLVSHSNLHAARADGLLSKDQGDVLAHGSAVGIDLEEFMPERFNDNARKSARESIWIANASFVLAYVGRPIKRKGFPLLVSAWEKSTLGQKNGVLLLAGCTQKECDGVLGHVVRGVKGLGYLTDLKAFYAASDTVALPSDHEGFPYSLLEGAAAGRALIGTDIPGIRCAIRNGETGILVAPGEASLIGAIQKLASDPILRSILGQNARLRVEKEFDRRTVLEALMTFYKTKLGLDC